MFSEVTEYMDIRFAMFADVTPKRTGPGGRALDHGRVFSHLQSSNGCFFDGENVVALRVEGSEARQVTFRNGVATKRKTRPLGSLGNAVVAGQMCDLLLQPLYSENLSL